MTRWGREGLRVVAVLAAPPGVWFDRAAVVVERDGRWLLAARWDAEAVTGAELDEADLVAMVAEEEVVRVSPTEPRGSTWAWMVDDTFGSELQLLVSQASPFAVSLEGSRRILLVDETAHGWVRPHWASVAVDRARAALERGSGREALRWAQLGWLVGTTVSPEQVALVVRAGELAGDPQVDVRAIERRVRGASFDAQVDRWLGSLPAAPVLEVPPWRHPARHAIAEQLREAA